MSNFEHDGKWMYFEIMPGEIMDAINAWENSVRECREKASALCSKVGADDSGKWEDSRKNIVGFSFSEEPPKGWKHYKKDPKGMFRPDKTKVGKSYAERMKELAPKGLDAAKRLIGPQMVLSSEGRALLSSHWKIYGATYVAAIPSLAGGDFTPHGSLRPLTLSEHFQLKKQAEANP